MEFQTDVTIIGAKLESYSYAISQVTKDYEGHDIETIVGIRKGITEGFARNIVETMYKLTGAMTPEDIEKMHQEAI